MKHRSLLLLLLIVFCVPLASIVASHKAHALIDNDSLSLHDQHSRTQLYPISDRCLSDVLFRDEVSGSDLNKRNIWTSTDNHQFPIGHEIDPADKDGTRLCKKMDYDAALGFIGMTWQQFRDTLYRPSGDGNYKLVSRQDIEKLKTSLRQKIQEKKNLDGQPTGPKERARRTIVGLSHCIQTIRSGFVAERATVNINGVTYQYREVDNKALNGDTKISVGFDIDGVDGRQSCATLIQNGRSAITQPGLMPAGATLDDVFNNPAVLTGAPIGSGPGGGGDTGSNENSCEGGSNFGIEWLACGILRGIDNFVSGVRDFINGQLNFDVDQNLNQHVKQAWSIFRILSTILLVIILLVAIMAQATGGGPFEAYTIRKVLPKIVIAIVVIQISWWLFRYVIEIANAAGQGIYSLLAAPFGGPDALSLDKLIGSLDSLAAKGILGGATLITGIALIVNPFGALMLGFLVFIAVIVALATLLFRQALIIACVIFGPIALIAWILPGTRRYWQLWSVNFIKALFLFPIIAGMIVVGQIFAWIVASGGGSTGILDVFAVLLGFFGPYFLLPKAFSWGGTVLSKASQVIEGGFKPVREKGKQEIKGLAERQQGKQANKYDPNAGLAGRTFRRIQSGSFLPTERSRRLTIAKGDKWAGERNDEAIAYVRAVGESARVNGYKDPKTGKLKTDSNGNAIKGVEAMKLAYNDIAGNEYKTDAQKRAARQAVHQMLATSSWIEFQSATLESGPNEGSRIVDLPAWRDQLNKDPGDYSATLGPRPDFAPDVIESAQKNVAKDLNINVSDIDPKIHQGRIDKVRLKTAIGRLKPGSVSGLHFGFFEDIAKTGDSELADQLGEQLKKFQTEGGQLGQQAVASLLGSEMEKKVNSALSLSTSPSTQSVQNIIHSSATSAPGAAAPGAEAAATTEGEVRIPHQPGDVISPGGVIQPPERRTRPPEDPGNQ